MQRGLEAILGPSEDPLQGSLEAVILLAAHAFRLELTISVAVLYPFEEFLTFAEAQPIFTQTLLDQQFNVDTYLLDTSTVIPRLIRSRKVWPRLQHTLLQVAGLRDAGRSAVSVLMSAPFPVLPVYTQPVGAPPKESTWDSSLGKWIKDPAAEKEEASIKAASWCNNYGKSMGLYQWPWIDKPPGDGDGAGEAGGGGEVDVVRHKKPRGALRGGRRMG